MPRTTVNIYGPILKDLRRLQKKQRKPLGRMISDLLARALAGEKTTAPRARFTWAQKAMHARVDLADKEAVRLALEPDRRVGRR